ncbi:MAPEG family protein [bacterium]|nr:MAPEG family protein [bacterium]
MHLIIIPRYAALLGLLYVALTLRVIRYRRKHNISLGSGSDERLERLRASHSNFAEFAPLILLLLTMLELKGWSAPVLHLLGSALTVGRLAHSQSLPLNNFHLRLLGMILTLSCLIASSLLLTLN